MRLAVYAEKPLCSFFFVVADYAQPLCYLAEIIVRQVRGQRDKEGRGEVKSMGKGESTYQGVGPKTLLISISEL